jgi:ribonuclease III
MGTYDLYILRSLVLCKTPEMAETEDVFSKLKEASESVSRGLDTILKIAPEKKLYETLLDSASNPFLKGLLMKGNDSDIDLEDSGIKFAVLVKDLYESGHLDILKALSDKDLVRLEKWKASSIGDHIHDHDVGGHAKKSDDGANSGVATPLGTTGNDQVDEKDGEIDAGNYSELYTEASLVNLSLNDKNNDAYKTMPQSVHKRERKYEVCTKENAPELPPIHDQELKAKVFTHSSVLSTLNIPEEKKIQSHNERIEFLGDAFLQFIASMIIYERFPNFSEGQLSILRSKLVSNDRLFKMSQLYGFDKQLRKNFNDSSVLNNKIYADVFEAYLGAINEEYMLESIDGETNVAEFMKGWFMAKEWVEKLCEDELRSFDPSIAFKMQYSKSSKQDLRLLIGLTNIPEYVRCNISNKRFLSCVKIKQKVYGYGIGTSNKEADSRAATDALSNPGIKKICSNDLWQKFEDSVGVDEHGGLNFDQYPTKVDAKDMEALKRDIALKFKNGDIKMLASKNNPNTLLIGDKEREIATVEIEAKHSITNTAGELDADSKSNNNISSKSNSRSQSRSTTPLSAAKNKRSKKELEEEAREDKKKYPSAKYYSKEYTMGRGGIFSEEYDRIPRSQSKRKGGMARHAVYNIVDIDDDGGEVRHSTREMMCHEVLESCDDVDMDSKNRVNSFFNKRGGSPNYNVFRTAKDEFLCELWFNSQQIVSYGLDRNKRFAAQKAAMLALKREDFYGTSESDDDQSASDSESESESSSDSESGSDSDSETSSAEE